MTTFEPMKVEYTVKNTFVDCPALRSLSLEEPDRGTKSCPGSALVGHLAPREGVSLPLALFLPAGEADHHAPRSLSLEALLQAPFPAPPGLSDAEREEVQLEYLVKNTFIQYPTPRGKSLEEFLQDRGSKSCPGSKLEELPGAAAIEQDRVSGSSTTASEDGDVNVTAASPDALQPAVAISLTEGLGIWSAGSAGHHVGRCKPCAFLWKDGCASGQACDFCHLCPPGEVKRRKKEKSTFRKALRQARQVMRFGMF